MFSLISNRLPKGFRYCSFFSKNSWSPSRIATINFCIKKHLWPTTSDGQRNLGVRICLFCGNVYLNPLSNSLFSSSFQPLTVKNVFVCLIWRDSPQWTRVSSFTRKLDHTELHTTIGRTPLDKWSARRKDLYLTTHNSLTTDRHPQPRLDLNPQSQQASGRRPTP